MKKLACSLLVAVAAMTAGSAVADSGDCAGGTATPAGITVLQTGDPTTGPASLSVCLDDSTAPTPIQGSATLSGDPNGQSGYADVDGDASNAAVEQCLDGFVRADSDGNIYSSPDGDFVDTDPSTVGDQQASPKTPEEFLADLQADCAPA